MREIKFKIWDSIANVMYESFELKDFIGGMADHYVYLQYSGLKDKNGKEIYEGDIVEITKDISRGKYRVDWDGLRGEWVLINDFIPKRHHLGIFCDALGSPNKAEIIGNIYENPKLLK